MKKQIIAIWLGAIIIFYSTSYNYAYFRDYAYQDNIVKIETPSIEEGDENNFETTANIEGDYFENIFINLDGHFNTDVNLKLGIEQKYGVFENKFFTISTQVGKGINMRLTRGDIFRLKDFEYEYPTLNKLDVVIKYNKNNEILERKYVLEFIRDSESVDTLKVYFYEKDKNEIDI